MRIFLQIQTISSRFHSADLGLFSPLWKICLQSPLVWKGHTNIPGWDDFCLSQPRLGSKLLTFSIAENGKIIPTRVKSLKKKAPGVCLQGPSNLQAASATAGWVLQEDKTNFCSSSEETGPERREGEAEHGHRLRAGVTQESPSTPVIFHYIIWRIAASSFGRGERGASQISSYFVTLVFTSLYCKLLCKQTNKQTNGLEEQRSWLKC